MQLHMQYTYEDASGFNPRYQRQRRLSGWGQLFGEGQPVAPWPPASHKVDFVCLQGACISGARAYIYGGIKLFFFKILKLYGVTRQGVN